MNFLAKLFEMIGGVSSNGTSACWYFIFDEPTAPKSIIEK